MDFFEAIKIGTEFASADHNRDLIKCWNYKAKTLK